MTPTELKKEERKKMRKIHKVYATRGCLTAEGSTAKEAKVNLETMIDWALQYRPLVLESRFGYVFAITANATGFEYSMFEPAHGLQRGPTCCWGRDGSLDDVLQACRMHAAQNAWTFGVDDAAHIEASGLNESKKRELAHWIAFQRAYREAKANGFTAGEAHEWACRAPYQVTV
jgi:hypothetical protein